MAISTSHELEQIVVETAQATGIKVEDISAGSQHYSDGGYRLNLCRFDVDSPLRFMRVQQFLFDKPEYGEDYVHFNVGLYNKVLQPETETISKTLHNAGIRVIASSPNLMFTTKSDQDKIKHALHTYFTAQRKVIDSILAHNQRQKVSARK